MGLLLAGLSSFFFVVLDVLRKILGSRLGAVDVVIGINLGSAFVLGVVLFVNGLETWDFTFVVLASIECVTFTIASLLYVRAVSISPLSLTIPYLGFTPVVSVLVALVVLQETPRPSGLLGIVLVVSGAVILHRGESSGLRPLITAPFREPGSWMMLIVAAIWGVTTSIDKIAIRHGSEIMLAFSLSAGSFLLLVGTRVVQARTDESNRWRDRRTILLLVLAALVAGAAVLCQFFAYRELFVAYVETIKRAGGLFSVLIGVFGFGEGGFENRFPAAVLMLIGITLIMFS